MLEELMKKAKKKEMDPMEKDAKMGVLKSIRDMAMDKMKGDMGGLKKVTVADNDDEAVKMGLEKAKSMIGKENEMEDKMEPEELMEHEASESPEKEKLEKLIDPEHEEKEASIDGIEEMSPEEMKLLLKKLMSKGMA